MLKICKYNKIICFLLNIIKFFLSLNCKTSQKTLAVRSMLTKFLQERMCVVSSLSFSTNSLAKSLSEDRHVIPADKGNCTLSWNVRTTTKKYSKCLMTKQLTRSWTKIPRSGRKESSMRVCQFQTRR